MSLENIGDLAIHKILSKVGSKGTSCFACVGKRYNEWANDDILWSKFCHHELNLNSTQDPFGNPCTTFKATYQAWRESFEMYPWPLVQRVKRCWDNLKLWLSTNFPEVLGTLRNGASEDEINKLETSLEVKLPLPTRVLYRFCDGQEFMSDSDNEDLMENLLGLIGGYSFYGNLINVFLLSVNQVITETKAVRDRLLFGPRSKYILVARTSTHSYKLFFLNCENGQLHVGTKNLATVKEMMPCVPDALISSGDGMLLWLEEHGRRLHDRIVKIRTEGNCRSINLFPEEGPLCSTAVTNGVKVRASSVFVPEFSDLKSETRKYFFSYSIRMSLLPEGCKVHGSTYDSCQLYWRRWIIRKEDTVVDDVNGKAVIGQYPLLRPGEKEFVYESCSPQRTSTGSIEGSFTFVPGSLKDPKGSEFEVEVAKFLLKLPDYIFRLPGVQYSKIS